MAIVQVNFFSEALLRNVNFLAVLPMDQKSVDGGVRYDKNHEMKTLYLLHGIYGSETDWIAGTRVARWAFERNLAVIMPAGENKFYCDLDKTSDNFKKFIGEELVQFTRLMFRLSEKREDSYIAGLSMGGEGAVATALSYPETFSYVGGFSSAFMFEPYPTVNDPIGLKANRPYMEAILGPESQYKGSKNDYYHLAEQVIETGSTKPVFYLSCGLQDGLLEVNRKYASYLKELGYQVDYYEEDGDHEWDFWDRQLLLFMNWLPLER